MIRICGSGLTIVHRVFIKIIFLRISFNFFDSADLTPANSVHATEHFLDEKDATCSCSLFATRPYSYYSLKKGLPAVQDFQTDVCRQLHP